MLEYHTGCSDITQSNIANVNASATGGSIPHAKRRSRPRSSFASPESACSSASRRTDHRRSVMPAMSRIAKYTAPRIAKPTVFMYGAR
jgi:hypothetical protein